MKKNLCILLTLCIFFTSAMPSTVFSASVTNYVLSSSNFSGGVFIDSFTGASGFAPTGEYNYSGSGFWAWYLQGYFPDLKPINDLLCLRSNVGTENYITYALDSSIDASKLSIDVTVYYEYNWLYGNVYGKNPADYFSHQLQDAPMAFTECATTNGTYTNIPGLASAVTLFQYSEGDYVNNRHNKVVYTLSGLSATTKFIKIALPLTSNSVTTTYYTDPNNQLKSTIKVDEVKFTQTGGGGIITPSPSPIPSPIPSSSVAPTATPIASPIATPTATPTATPVVSSAPSAVTPLGLGQSFMLYPSDYNGISPSSGFTLDSAGAVVSGGTYLKGPFTMYNTAKIMNGKNGTSSIYVSPDALIARSSNGTCYGRYDVMVGYGTGGSYVLYTPTSGLLTGVDTNVTVAYTYCDGKTGVDAIITYNGGQTKRLNMIPNGDMKLGLAQTELIDIGTYTNLETVQIQTLGGHYTFLPSVVFKVVNEHPGSPAPILPYRKYIKPNIDTVTPGLISPVPTPNTESPISINEAESSNVSGITDKNGKNSDWIELYNSSNVDVNVDGYGLTDDTNVQYKWNFPSGSVVPAKGYLVVYASGEDTVLDGELHTNFSISKGGETIMLSNPNGGIVSVMDLPSLDDDITMARYPDGSVNLRKMNPSPGAANSSANIISAYVKKPEFSAESGFYPNNFDLTLSAQNATLYYTLDGSTPTASSTKYSMPLTIMNRTQDNNVLSAITYATCNYAPTIKVDKAMIIRAIAIDSEGNVSDVVTKSYFVGYNMSNDFNNAAVLSLVTDASNLYDAQTGLFTNISDTNEDGDWERPAHLAMFESDGKMVIDQNIGVRVRGLMSKSFPQKGLNFYARSEYGQSKFNYQIWDGLTSEIDGKAINSHKSFCIRNGGQRYDSLRFIDGAIQKVGDGLGGLAIQESRPGVLFINGEYWGPYYIQERVSTDYVESHFGVPAEDVMLMKNHVSKGDSQPDDYAVYMAEQDWLSNTDFSVESNYQELLRKYDIDSMINYYAANMAMSNRDWGSYNFAVWRSRTVTDKPYQDGKWRFLMYDCDMSYDTDQDNVVGISLSHPWAKALLSNPTLKKRFVNAICDVFSSNYNPQRVMNEFTYWYDEALPLMPDFYQRFGGDISTYTNTMNGWYTHVTSRDVYYPEFIKSGFGLIGDYTHLVVKVNDNNAGSVKVNSITPDFSNGSYGGRYFTDYTQTLTAVPKPGYVFTGWTKSDGTTLSGETDKTIEVTLCSNGSMVQANFVPVGETEAIMISTPEDLAWMADMVNNNNSEYGNRNYVLTNDITLTGTENFTAIGNSLSAFTGIFDGNYHTISGINFSSTKQGQGLFGYIGEGGIVKHIGVTNITIISTGIDGKNVGGIVGNNKGLIENCYSTGTLSGTSTVGGIVGNNSGGSVKNCYSIADINSESPNTLGGIAGKTELGGTIINCYSLINPVAKNDGGNVDVLTSTKTSDEFISGIVTNLLNENGTLDIWTNGSVSPIFSNPDINLSCIGNEITLSTIVAVSSAKLIAASYSNDQLIGIKIFDITISANNSTTKDISDLSQVTGGTVKVMLLSGLNNVKPLHGVLIKNN